MAYRCRPTRWLAILQFALDGQSPSAASRAAYCALLKPLADKIAGVHLYGLARPSMQPAAPRLTRLPVEELERCAEQIQKETGIRVVLSP